MRQSLSQDSAGLWVDGSLDVTIGQCVVCDRNLACAILIRHKTLSGGDVKVCLSSDTVGLAVDRRLDVTT